MFRGTPLAKRSTVTSSERATLSPVPAVGALDFFKMLLGARTRFQVTGLSMSPTLQDGDTVLVDTSAYAHNPPCIGDVVVCRHPFKQDVHIIKRIADLTDCGDLILMGDNPIQSTDSQTLGAIPRIHLRGRVTSKSASKYP